MPDTPPSTDAEILDAFREGDREAFARIYDTHADAVFSGFLGSGLSREEAADATHETFIEAASQLELQDQPGDLEAWLFDLAGEFAGAGQELAPVAPEDMVSAPPALRARVLSKVDRGITVPPPQSRAETQWARLGVFAVVTVVIGLIGLAVSAAFDPLPPPATVPVAEGPAENPAASPSTTAAGRPSTTGAQTPPTTGVTGGSTTPSTAAGAPAALDVSTESIDFGDDGTVEQFDVTNTGGQAGQWRLESSSGAIALSATEGEIAGGETVTVELSLDRDGLQEGDLNETLTLSWDGGEARIEVVGTHEDNPIIHNPVASPSAVDVAGNEECSNTQTTITARVRDISPLDSVVVRWEDGSGARETAMEPTGADIYEATIGPFAAVGTTEARVVAFDERGNAGGASVQVSVVACP